MPQAPLPQAEHHYDRRGFGRRKTCFHGMLLTETRAPIRCTVVNVSAGGALVLLSESVRLPYNVRLHLDVVGRTIDCELKRECLPYVGVMFVEPQPDLVHGATGGAHVAPRTAAV